MYWKNGKCRGAFDDSEGIVDAIKEEIDVQLYIPTIIMGEFNEALYKLESIKELIKGEGWTDVGACASRWGRGDDAPTCWSSEHAKPSRIDGVVCNIAILPPITSFDVEKIAE